MDNFREILSETRIWTDHGVFKAKELIQITKVKPIKVYDGFGRISRLIVTDGGTSLIHTFISDLGQVISVGEKHNFYSVVPGDIRPQFRPVSKMVQGDTIFTFMPNRKIKLSYGSFSKDEIGNNVEAVFNILREKDRIEILSSTYDAYQNDDNPSKVISNIYLKPPTLEEMKLWTQLVSFYGITAIPHVAHNIIELDRRRPSCFATKLFAGRGNDPDDILNDLIDSHIVFPVLPFTQMVKIAQETGHICEGETTNHLRTLTYTLNTEKEHSVCNIELIGDCDTLETSWTRI